MKIPKDNLRELLIAAIVIVTVLYVMSRSGYVLIFGLGIVCFILIFMWSPPPKHKTFSDDDRIEAMSRAYGASPPPKLWVPPGIHAKQKISQREFRSVVKKANRSLIRFFLIPIVALLIYLALWLFSP